MAYVDQNQSKEKTVAFVITLIIMVGVGYALVTGLAYNVIKHKLEDMKVIDVQDQPPPPPPPPPPKEQPKPEVPPPVSPPPLVKSPAPPPPITTVTTLHPPPPVIAPPPPVIAPPPPAKPSQAVAAKVRGDPNFGITDADYPPDAQRAEQQGTTAFSFDVGPDGRVSNCQVTSSSGSSSLDDTTCKLVTRRARYTPAKDAAGNPLSSHVSRSIRWVLPKD